jgi:hypothetical protein
MRGAAVLLGLLDGSRDLAQILAAAGDFGISAEAADRVITLLAAGGALHDFPVTAYRAMPHGLRSRLAPELATAALAHGDADGGARILARRQGACVRVEGMSQVGLCIASFLTASGIGMVVSTGRPAGLEAGPGASPAAGPPAPARVPPPAGPSAPAGEPAPSVAGRHPDLVILADITAASARDPRAGRRPASGRRGQRSHRRVRPLVPPGRTACLRCLT